MLPENERICLYCNQKAIENEMHFVMSCPLYVKKRTKMLKRLNLNNIPKDEAFRILMTAKTLKVASVFSKYISECLEMRKMY